MGSSAGRQNRTDSTTIKYLTSRLWSALELRGLLNGKGEHNKTPSSTTLYYLPLEIVDIIVQKSYIHWISNASSMERDKDVIRSLMAVDVCFYRRIIRQRFKKAIWRYLTDFYGKTKRRRGIIRNNRNYLLDNIQPNEKLIDSLLSNNCITKEQSHFIQRQRSARNRNADLLKIMRSFDERKFSNFVKCLQNTKQKIVAKILENGGGVIKIKVHVRGAKCRPTTKLKIQLLRQEIEDLRDKTKPRSKQTDKLIAELMEAGIEILSSQLDRQTVDVWIWCRTQTALKHIQKLYKSNQLRDLFFEITNRSISMLINIDKNQFKKTVVVSLISINFTQRIERRRANTLGGVTKLRNEIYVLCESNSSSALNVCVIRVFQDRTPFHLQKEIEIKGIQIAGDIGSSEKENCIYISDLRDYCVWKITRETGNHHHKSISWLTTDYEPRTLSVSSDGQLLMFNDSSHSLMIYGSDAELIRSITLPVDITYPHHAVETSIGNVILIHAEEKEEMVMEEWKPREWAKRRGGQNWRLRKVGLLVVSELTRDGQTVIRRIIPSDKPQRRTFDSYYISLDSDDRVFVADTCRHTARVFLLDSDLKWNRILSPTGEGKKDTRFQKLCRLYYDKEMKQLIVVDELYGTFKELSLRGIYATVEVNVYTLSRN